MPRHEPGMTASAAKLSNESTLALTRKGIKMNKNLYVGNLSFKVTDDDLKANFAEAGEVASASIIKDKFTGQSKGFGFVEMKTEEGATRSH